MAALKVGDVVSYTKHLEFDDGDELNPGDKGTVLAHKDNGKVRVKYDKGFAFNTNPSNLKLVRSKASKRGPGAPRVSGGITPLGVASALDAVDPVTSLAVDVIADVSPKLVTALGLRETGASLATCVQLVNRAPDVSGKLIAGACNALSSAAFMRSESMKRRVRSAADAAGGVPLDLDLDKISAFGFLWTLAKLTGLRDFLLRIAKMPCDLLRKCVMTIPLGGKLWAAVDMTLSVPVKIVKLALENFYHPLMMGVSGALEPVVGLCGGVVCTVGVLPLVAGGVVEAVVGVAGDGVATILWGAGEVIEGILGPLGTPIKFTVNVAGEIVSTTLKATGMLVGGILSLPFLMGQAMISVMD
jgi:hypothetical protein